jgi:hypothetical protein
MEDAKCGSSGAHARGRQNSLTHESKRNYIARAPACLEINQHFAVNGSLSVMRATHTQTKQHGRHRSSAKGVGASLALHSIA